MSRSPSTIRRYVNCGNGNSTLEDKILTFHQYHQIHTISPPRESLNTLSIPVLISRSVSVESYLHLIADHWIRIRFHVIFSCLIFQNIWIKTNSVDSIWVGPCSDISVDKKHSKTDFGRVWTGNQLSILSIHIRSNSSAQIKNLITTNTQHKSWVWKRKFYEEKWFNIKYNGVK